ncbi:MAG: chromosome segregation protein SMC [Clostridiales bacterium]|nr:chromosome segregation protein SMC [Candidatus Apopatousia equi]
MNLKRIELLGFKSFADKTVVDFVGGITAIVGPNGCGKSNVADAIRWVLGEQSSKLLRGTSMQDVIFNGTEKRKSLSYCEVSLILDNSERMIDVDYDEVALSRKLYRSGESEYLINKNTCRLADIREILHDSGIGRDGYSIIGQGKVEEIVSSKPENRRGIFEEAAGIAKFKYKKQEAERKLERTRDNLSRVNDILLEIDRQLKPLREQAETAKKYLDFKEKLKSYEINNYIYNYDNAESNKQVINERISAIQEEMDAKQLDLDKAINDYSKNMEDINKIDKNMQSLYEQITELKVALEKSSGETNVIRERLNLLKDQALKLKQDLEKEQENISNIESSLKQKNDKKAQNEIDIDNLNQDSNSIQEKYLSIVDELAKSEDEAQENQQLMISALDKLSDIKADISKLSTERLNAVDRQATLLAEINSNEQKVSSFELEKISALEQEAVLNSQNESLIEKMEQTSNDYLEVKSLVSKEQMEIASLYSTSASLDARYKMLVEMQKNFDGFNGAVKSLLQKSESNNLLKQNIVGVVASLMSVPKEYEVAIEMALGNQVQNIVTESEENAKTLISYLKDNSLGRATFLPITSLKPRNLHEFSREISSTKGSFGIASELVSYDKSLSNVFENLLGGTVIVDNLITAVNLAKQTRYGFKIVTLDGDVINPQGSITGGSKKFSVSSVVGRDREIQDIEGQLESLKVKTQTLEIELENNRQKLDRLEKEQNEYSTSKYEVGVKLAKIQENKQKIVDLLEESKQKLELDKQELASINTKIKAIDIAINQHDEEKKGIDTNKSSANDSILKRQEKFENLKKERDEYNAKMLEVKVNIASLKSENISIDEDILRLQQEQEEGLQNIEQISQYILQNAKTIENAEQIISTKTQDTKYKETNDKLTEVNEKLNGLGEYKAKLQEEIKRLDEERMTLTSRINKLQDKRFQEDLNLSKIDTELENMQARVWEDYGLNYSSAMEFKVENYDLQDGLKQANIFKREIDKLGYVNVNAIEDSRLQQERYDELSVQNSDLLKAEEDLTTIINQLAEEMTTRFDSAFGIINENFGKIFKELFGGGRAELVLVPSESGDLLEQGVDIIAEPPGKKLQNITLLSGGEKALTAIAILFSILKLRPMPFVLLDEIEAALDEANVGRFAKYLQRFSSETQFIVITHRKPTMELADSLYGVTMQEKGVSKIVSVKLSDAIEQEAGASNN